MNSNFPDRAIIILKKNHVVGSVVNEFGDRDRHLTIYVNTPNRYTTGTSLGTSKCQITNCKKRVNNQVSNDVWRRR